VSLTSEESPEVVKHTEDYGWWIRDESVTVTEFVEFSSRYEALELEKVANTENYLSSTMHKDEFIVKLAGGLGILASAAILKQELTGIMGALVHNSDPHIGFAKFYAGAVCAMASSLAITKSRPIAKLLRKYHAARPQDDTTEF